MKLEFRFKQEAIKEYLKENKIKLRNLTYFWGISMKNAEKIYNEKPFEIDMKYLSKVEISDNDVNINLNDLIRKKGKKIVKNR